MPTVLLVDCSLNMAERFPFVMKQSSKTETAVNMEKRSLVAKFIEILMSNSRNLTKLETVALIYFASADTIKIVQHFTRNTETIIKSVQKIPILGDFALKPALEFTKKYMTTVYGSQRSQKILVFTDSSHRDDELNSDAATNSNEMDVDLRDSLVDECDQSIAKSNSQTEISFICIKKPSATDRTRLEEIVKRSKCSLSKIYWLLNRGKDTPMTVSNELIQNMIERIKTDAMSAFISTVKCGHYESQLAVYPSIKPAILKVTGELLQPSNTLTVNGFIELSAIRSAMAISKHILLPIQRYQKSTADTPMFATKKSATGNGASSSASAVSSSNKRLSPMNNFYYLLLISLKKEKSVALVSVNDQWYGTIHCQKLDRKKKPSRLILSVFEPGDCIPWIPSFERLGPYAFVFPPGPSGELVYKKQTWSVKPFARSYTETFLIWCRQNNFQNDINKFIRNAGKLPDKVNIFQRELNKICRGAFIYGLRERLFNLLQKLFQRQVELGKIKPEGVKHIQRAIVYMNRLSSSDRYIKFEDS